MILVKVEQLLLSNVGAAVLLRGAEDDRSLPIVIGPAEAQAIALCVNSVDVPRPLTHDLLKNMLDCLECRLMKVEIVDLKEGTFYANLILEQDNMEIKIDARPSDAIALALRVEAPIYVDDAIMSKAGRIFTDPNHPDPEKMVLEHEKKELTPLEVLHKELQIAIDDERYEDAAQLRDKIDSIKDKSTKN